MAGLKRRNAAHLLSRTYQPAGGTRGYSAGSISSDGSAVCLLRIIAYRSRARFLCTSAPLHFCAAIKRWKWNWTSRRHLPSRTTYRSTYLTPASQKKPLLSNNMHHNAAPALRLSKTEDFSLLCSISAALSLSPYVYIIYI